MLGLEDDLSGAVFDALDTGLIVLDGDQRVTAWNAWMAAASGIPAEAAHGKPLEELFPRSALRPLTMAAAEALDAGVSSILTHSLHPALLPLRTRAGRELVHNASVRPIGQRPYSRCLLQVTDVTLSTEREQILRQRQNARYHAVVDSAPDAILTLDAEGLIQLANPAAAREFGYAAKELVGQPMAVLLGEQQAWREAWKGLLEGEALHPPLEVAGRRRDGSPSHLEISASRWLSDSRVFVTAILRDVNARRAAEDALRSLNQTLEQRVQERTAELMRAEEQLRQAQKMEAVGQLTGGIAHDFNNLLQIVTGNLEILGRNLPSDAARLRRATENAMNGARRAATLTQRLLAFSRRQPLAPRAVSVNTLVVGMSDLLSRALGETIALETVLAAGLWRVEADPNQLESAILNLAVNARDAMPDGGKLTIETNNAYLDQGYVHDKVEVSPGQYVVTCVSDTGVGMQRATLDRVFEPFFTTKEVGQGTGLGLSQVYGFVKQSGGHVAIYSEPGEGTTVKIYLPRLLGAAAEEEEVDGVPAPIPEGTHRESILVVEDDQDVRAYTVEVLRELGYRVIEADHGLSALRLLEQHDTGGVDLLFTDIVLPGGMNGEQLARRARELRRGLKVLFTTGYARNAIVHQGRLDAGVELLTKPFTYADLAARVRGVLDKRSG